MKLTQSALGVAGLAVLAFMACSSSSSSDYAPILASETNNVMIPTLQQLDANAAALVTATTALTSSISEANLEAAQNAWRAVRASWEMEAAFRFGPSQSPAVQGGSPTTSITSSIDTFPVDSVSLEAIVANSAPITNDIIDALPDNQKGFFALEYLLFNPAGNQTLLSQYTANSRYGLYLNGAATSLKSNTGKLLAAWGSTGGNFAYQFQSANNPAYTSGKAAFDALVNQAANALEIVVNTDLGTPLGKENEAGAPQPNAQLTVRSDNTANDITAILQGVQNVYQGYMTGGTPASGSGIATMLSAKNSGLATEFGADISDAMAKVAAIPHPFQTALSGDTSAVDAAYNSSKTAKDTLATDCSSALGTTINFADNDGD